MHTVYLSTFERLKENKLHDDSQRAPTALALSGVSGDAYLPLKFS
jgi:hypothetical protein